MWWIAISRPTMSGVSSLETDLRFSGREDFWIIVAARSEDETEIRAGETTGGRCNQGHPTGDASTLFGRGKDPRGAGRAARRGEHCRTVSPRGHRLVDVLWLVERVPSRPVKGGLPATRRAPRLPTR